MVVNDADDLATIVLSVAGKKAEEQVEAERAVDNRVDVQQRTPRLDLAGKA